MQTDDVEIVVGKQRCVMAVDAARFADEDFESLLRLVADGRVVAGNEVVERRIAAYQFRR